MVTETSVQVPAASASVWVELASGKKTGVWTALPVKIMMTRVRSQMERDSSPAGIAERAREIHSFFEKNGKLVEKDLRSLLG